NRCTIVLPILFAFATGAGAASLDSLLADAARDNPDIAASMHAWRAAAQAPSQVAVLPDPQVTVQSFSVGSPRPFAGYTNSDFAYVGFGISQDVPYPGKLSLRSQAAERDAAVARDRYEATRVSIVEQVKASYFELAYIQKTLALLQRDQTLLEQIEKIATARYRLGKGTQQDILKAQLQKTRILNELAHHHELMGMQQALLSKLLNRPPGADAIE